MAWSDAQPAAKQVLVLQSLNRGNLVLDNFTGNFRVSLDQRARKPVHVVQVVVGPTGFVDAPERAVVDYIRSMYVDRAPPDLIVTIGGPAAAFARKHRPKLFPEAPLLFASVDQRYLRDAPLGQNESAVAVVNDFPRMVDDILRVLPETKQVFMVVGSGAIGRFWRRELESEFTRFRDRVAFVWSGELSLAEIQRRVARLPSNSAIFYIAFGTDALGGAYADEQVLAELHAKANAPLFASHTPLFGYGIVGGSLMNIGNLAHNTGDVASRILNGEPAGSIRVPPQSRGPHMFDWRELQRWRIPETRLPPGSVVHFRGPSLWDEYQPAVLTAVGVLLLQSLMIAWLMHERRARQRAEIDSRRNLALAADINRRETISALTSSIGHELGQPLSSIVHNAQALQTMVTTNRASPDATAAIVRDIKGEAALAKQIIERHRAMLRSHELHKKPIDLHAVIDESLALFVHELRARQIETTLDLSSTPCVIDGDQVLLKQVFVNLIRNAIDALAEPPARRHITIRSAGMTTSVEVSVSDTGTGFSPAIIGTLFTPFVTEKPHGLGIGLVIVQRILDAHGGTISAEKNPDGGATLTVTLPRSETPNRISERLGGSNPS